MAYTEKSVQPACNSTVAVFVIALKPRRMNAREAAEPRARCSGRNLQSLGAIGLVGTSPRCELKVPLDPEQESRLMSASLEHLHGPGPGR